jgi:hypothetical protein
MSFSEILEALGVSSSFLTYHLESLGELVSKTSENKYRLSSFGEAAIVTMIKVEEIPRNKHSRLDKVFHVSFKQLIVTVLLIAIVSGSYIFISNRIETHKQWGGMADLSQEFETHFLHVRDGLFGAAIGWTNTTIYEFYMSELRSAEWSLTRLIWLDSAHTYELVRVDQLVMTLESIGENFKIRENSSQSRFSLTNAIATIAFELNDAYWHPLNNVGINFQTGPPFWYLGSSPPDETLLRQVADLAVQANEAIILP